MFFPLPVASVIRSCLLCTLRNLLSSELVNFSLVYPFGFWASNVTKISSVFLHYGLAISPCAPTNYQMKVSGRAKNFVVHSKYKYIIISTLYLLQCNRLKPRKTQCKTMASRLLSSTKHFMRHVYTVVKGSRVPLQLVF